MDGKVIQVSDIGGSKKADSRRIWRQAAEEAVRPPDPVSQMGVFPLPQQKTRGLFSGEHKGPLV